MPNAKLALGIVVGSLLAACFSANKPLDSTQTGNPPVIATDRIALRVSSTEVRVTGDPGAVQPGGSKVEVKNLTTGMSFTTEAAADGSFDLEVTGSANDAYSVRAKSGSGTSGQVYVIRGTAAVGDGSDGSLSCEQRNTLAGELLTQAAETADRTCTVDADCAPVLARASCYAPGCWFAYVSDRGSAAIARVGRDIDANLCADYEEDACSHALPKCAEPPAAVCSMGQCGSSAPGQPEEPAPSCNGWGLKAAKRLDEAFQVADRSCMVDSDCVRVPLGLSCREDCPFGSPFSQAGAAAISAAKQEIEAQECGEFRKLGCAAQQRACGVNELEVRCVQNMCTQVATQPQLPDCVVCLETSVQWESHTADGIDDIRSAGPCASYRRHRFNKVSANEFSCDLQLVACSAITSTGAISTAIAHPDVQRVLNSPENPVALGNTREVDSFRITIGMHQLDLGGSCEGAPPNCVPVPAGVERLRELLQQIDHALATTPMGQCSGVEDI